MKKILVIGGGFAGSYIAKKLEKKFDVTLVDTKDYFEFTPGILRTIVEPEHIKKIQILHSHYLKKTKILIGNVKEVNKDYIKINGKKITFDYLAICSGSRYTLPIKEQNIVLTTRANHLRNYYEKLIHSKNILIIGGGLVGVELAGEIVSKYNDKNITIVHAKYKLLERNNDKIINYASNFLKKNGVEIIYNERVISNHKKTNFKTDNNKTINTDLAFWCTGIKPNFEFMLKNFKESLNLQNQVIVNEYLQVNGQKNIFAAGDLTDRKEEKTAQNAKRQARIVIKNIISLYKNKKLHSYIIKETPKIISLGKYDGIFIFKNFVFGGLIAGIMKNLVEKKEMFFYRF